MKAYWEGQKRVKFNCAEFVFHALLLVPIQMYRCVLSTDSNYAILASHCVRTERHTTT